MLRLKQADLATLELAAQEGHIDLKYLDEAGFCLFSSVSYSYSRINQQKRLEQVRVLKGMETRSKSGGYSLERFKFKST